MLFTIIIRNGSANHYAHFDNRNCAEAFFQAVTQTFRCVELWSGKDLITQYNNQ